MRSSRLVCNEDGDDRSLATDWVAAGRADSLEAEVAKFKAAKAEKIAVAGGPAEPSMLDRTIDTLGTVLTYNFFIIIVFFTWFLVGVGAQFGADNTSIINAFRGAWDVLILPLLTTHMTLTFLSYGLEKLQGGAEDA